MRPRESFPASLWDDDATQVLDESEGHVTGPGLRDLLKGADAVLVARNVTRNRVNEIIRELRTRARKSVTVVRLKPDTALLG